MTLILNIALLIVGFVLLIKGADWFVDGASSTALNFKISKMIIGLTIVAFGTSAPELAVSIQAIANGSGDMVLGNVVGSCIMNILLILGIAAIIRPLAIREKTIKAELPITLLVAAVFVTLILDVHLGNSDIDMFSRADAIVILLVFGVFLNYTVRQALKKKEMVHEKAPFGLWQSLLLVAVGLVGIVIGSDLVVKAATTIATKIGVTERVISLTIVAFGTSLPELVTTIVSSKKGEQDLLIGNIIGSNIFNICVVLGIPVALFGNLIPTNVSILDMTMVLLSSFLLFIFAREGTTVTRTNGFIMLALFGLYYFIVMI